MKANYMSKITLLLFLLGVLYACGKDPSENSTPLPDSYLSEISIEQARTMFESVIGDCIEAYSETNYFSKKLFPGDYTPEWPNATKMQIDNRTIIICPISTSRRIVSAGAFFTNNKSEIFSTEIKQFLEFECKGSSMHIVLRNIIPDKCSNNWSKNTLVLPYESRFSGIVCNYSLTGKLEGMDRVICGKVVAQSKTLKLSSALKSIGILKISNTERSNTRSYGEDDGWNYDDYDDDFDYGWDNGNDGTNDHNDPNNSNDQNNSNNQNNQNDSNDQDNSNNWDDSDKKVDPWDPTSWTDDEWLNETRPGGVNDDGNDNYNGDDGADSSILIPVRHTLCGTIVGYVLIDEFENGIYYCPTCKKNVYISF